MSKAKKILLGYAEVTVVFIILCAMLFLGSFVVSGAGLWGSTIVEIAMLLAIMLWTRTRREDIKQRFPIEGPPLRSLVSAIWLALGGYFLMASATYFMAALFPTVTNESDVALYENILSKGNPALVVIAVVAVPAICEELIFRGFFLNKLKSLHKGPLVPIVVSSLLFAGVHFDLYKLPILFIMSLFLGYIAYKTNSVILPVLFHMLNNALAVVELYTMDAVEGEVMMAVIDGKSYIFPAIMMLALAAGFLFSGFRRFGAIRPKKWMRILCPILVIAVILFSTNAYMASVSHERLNLTHALEYPKSTVGSDSFSIEKNSLCTLELNAFQFFGVYAEFTVTNGDGEIVYEVEGENCDVNTTLVLEKGEYTISYSIAPTTKNENDSFVVPVILRVVETVEVEMANEVEAVNEPTSDTGAAETEPTSDTGIE